LPFPSRERPLLAAQGSRWLVIAIRRQFPISAVGEGCFDGRKARKTQKNLGPRIRQWPEWGVTGTIS
jgi:hypothetical protein